MLVLPLIAPRTPGNARPPPAAWQSRRRVLSLLSTICATLMVVPGLPCKTRAAPARINVELAAGGNTVACVNAALVDFA